MNNKKRSIELNKERIKRYKEKLEYFNIIILNLQSWIKEIKIKDFENLSLKEQFSIYHAFQIISELIADFAAMIVKDLNKIPKNDYFNLDLLVEQKLISNEAANDLKKANGLRNRIVHNYNGIDDNIAFKGIKEGINTFNKFEEALEDWLKKHS